MSAPKKKNRPSSLSSTSPVVRGPKIQQQSWDDCYSPPIDLYDPAMEPHSSAQSTSSLPIPIDGSKINRQLPISPMYTGSNLMKCSDIPKSQTPPIPSRKQQVNDGGNSIETKMEHSQHANRYQNSQPVQDQSAHSSRRSQSVSSNRKSQQYHCLLNDRAVRSEDSYHNIARSQIDEHEKIEKRICSSSNSPQSPRKFTFESLSPRLEDLNKTFDYYFNKSPNNLRTDSRVKSSRNMNPATSNQPANTHPENTDWTPSGDLAGMEQTDEQYYHNANKRCSVTTDTTVTTELTDVPSVDKVSTPGVKSVTDSVGGTDENYRKGRRRHAINIISNPGYQILHSSHSTLDCQRQPDIRTKDGRKSTSDLTTISGEPLETPSYAPSNSSSCSHQKHQPQLLKRRGSSKGGLAYLARRRSSRDSLRSVASDASIFSNEDIGPLEFQNSAQGRRRRTSNFLELPLPDHVRPRVCSLPERPYNPRHSDDLYRLRTFSISKGTVVNCGDSIISRRSRSNTSVNSTNSRASERSPFDGSCCGGRYTSADSITISADQEMPQQPRHRVVMLGDADVGKTALVSQFMTSEYMNTYDASLGKREHSKHVIIYDEFGEKSVSVLLDGEESEMVFIDHPSSEMSVENSLSTYEPDGCVVVYSVIERNSFRHAEEIINYLWRVNVTKDKAVILVGNKADLARSRVITSSEGKALAKSRDIKFIETSSGIQHNVDELLVGILKQIRLKENREKKVAAAASSKMRNSRTQMSLHMAKEILQKVCLTDITKSRSCENLHVL